MGNNSNKTQYIGFPPGCFEETRLRMDVLYAQEGVLVVNKPAGFLTDHHPWYPNVPNLVEGINKQLEDKKGEFLALGLNDRVKSIYSIEPAVSGATLLGIGDPAVEQLRNFYGSNQLQFTFEFLAEESAGIQESLTCDLPLAVHSKEEKMLVSNKTGKQAKTHFCRLSKIGKYSWWAGTTNYLRMHQIRVHAMECGLNIVGEDLYSQTKPIYLSGLKKKRFKDKDQEKPLYAGLCLYLKSIAWDEYSVEAPLAQKFKVLLTKLEQHLS